MLLQKLKRKKKQREDRGLREGGRNRKTGKYGYLRIISMKHMKLVLLLLVSFLKQKKNLKN